MYDRMMDVTVKIDDKPKAVVKNTVYPYHGAMIIQTNVLISKPVPMFSTTSIALTVLDCFIDHPLHGVVFDWLVWCG